MPTKDELKSILNKESEANFQDKIIQLATLAGWMVHAERPAWSAKGYRTPIQGNAGWSDLVLCKPPRLIIAELKRESGKVSPDQEDWIISLGGCQGVEVYLWRPSDFDRIKQILGVQEV
jgi:hypothetical protein